jgi:LuxR family transcriptional regulator, maltose regulon positive regulatory protein
MRTQTYEVSNLGVGANVGADAFGGATVNGGVVERYALFERLEGAARVTQLSALAGSGKTFLLRSWIMKSGLAARAGWVAIPRDTCDPQVFWRLVLEGLRTTGVGAKLVRAFPSAADLDGDAIVERLLEDLRGLQERLWLVIDDLHELGSHEALRQLEVLILRAPSALRFTLASRHEVQLGLHRLRLAAELTELRTRDLRFTLEEARALFVGGGVRLSEPALKLLQRRTDGWAAGLRLAALALAEHPDPERFAAEFCGSERTVAEYLLAEVLSRQPEAVRSLLLRTSVLERVNGPLADYLTDGSGGEGMLRALEKANAFVFALDTERSWFRYHPLFAELLRFELRRCAPAEVNRLHAAAAEWYCAHADLSAAIRHALAAQQRSMAARMLSEHWLALELNGQGGSACELLARVPAGSLIEDAELLALRAAGELTRGSLEEAARYIGLAMEGLTSLPEGRQMHAQLNLSILRLALARQRGDCTKVIAEARQVLALAATGHAAHVGSGDAVRALALIHLGCAEALLHMEAGVRHLEEGLTLARRASRPYLEFVGMAYAAIAASHESFTVALDRGTQAISMAGEHGLSHEPVIAFAYLALAIARLGQGQVDEADQLLEHAEATLRSEVEVAMGVIIYSTRASLEVTRGHAHQARLACGEADRLAARLVPGCPLHRVARARVLQTLLELGELELVEQTVEGLADDERATGEIRIIIASLRLARREPQEVIAALAPVLEGTAELVVPLVGLPEAFLLEAIARDVIGDEAGTERALERALDLAEPQGVLLPFLQYPVARLLERHARRRGGHPALIHQILDLLSGTRGPSRLDSARMLFEPLSDSEGRILRYLPTHLSRSEIAAELCVSVNTVKTHMRNLFTKLGAHSRTDAVDRARCMGLLAPKPRPLLPRELGSSSTVVRAPSNVSELRPKESVFRRRLAVLPRDVRAQVLSYVGPRGNRA